MKQSRQVSTSVVFDEEVTTGQIIGALQEIVERAHMHGVNVLGGTQTPFEGAAYYIEKGEEMRQAANQWLRKSGPPGRAGLRFRRYHARSQ